MPRLERFAYVALAVFGAGGILLLSGEIGPPPPDPLLVLTAVLAWLALLITWVTLRHQLARRPSPDVKIVRDGMEVKEVSLPVSLADEPPPDFSDEVQKRREDLLSKIPAASGEQPRTLVGLLGMGVVQAPSEEDIEEYKRDVESYCRGYEAFLGYSWTYERWWAQSFLLILSFANRRSQVPADGVRVLLHFPEGEGISIVEHDDVPPKPEEPEPPEPPRYRRPFDFLNPSWLHTPTFTGLTDRSLGRLTAIDIPGNVSGPTIRRGSIVLEYQVQELLHNMHDDTRADPVVLRFKSFGRWRIPFEIHARNLPTPKRGELTLEAVPDTKEQDSGRGLVS